MKKYIIKRTGRRCTRYPLVLEDGRKVTLNATGTHVWELSDADAARIRALPDTRVRCIEKPAPKKPAPKKAAPVVAPKKARTKKKGKE